MDHVVTLIAAGLWNGILSTLTLFWHSLYGLTLGFVASAIVQVAVPQRWLHRFTVGRPGGVAVSAGFGIISSSCSYGSAAATRSLYKRGADARAAFAFLISSTNMNLAILVMFWTLVGWRFALAELIGGMIIIAVVTIGLSLTVPAGVLARMRQPAMAGAAQDRVVPEDVVCGMTGSAEHTMRYESALYRFCSDSCRSQFAGDPRRYVAEDAGDGADLRSLRTWYLIAARAWGDVMMLRKELLIGYLIAGFAEALVPRHVLSDALAVIGGIPVIGYVLLLLVGLAIAVATFVCSMGNVPVAAFLKAAGVPLGANLAYIYGDLLILPLVRIYQRSFPRRLTLAFLGLFVLGACLAGAAMEGIIGLLPGSV